MRIVVGRWIAGWRFQFASASRDLFKVPVWCQWIDIVRFEVGIRVWIENVAKRIGFFVFPFLHDDLFFVRVVFIFLFNVRFVVLCDGGIFFKIQNNGGNDRSK